VTAAAVAVILFAALNLPFWYSRRRRSDDHSQDPAVVEGVNRR
jgi:hypothetical protein